MLDLKDLATFKAVAEEGGITRAAERLHRVQSAVTTRVKKLEADVGRPLFLREPGGMRLTPAGKTLLEYAHRVTALVEEADAAVRDPRPRGTVRLGSMESTAAVRLPDVLGAFGRRFGDVKLQLRTGNPVDLGEALHRGEIDAAFIATEDERFDRVVAFREQVVLTTKKGQTEPPDALLVFEEGCPHRRLLEHWFAAQGQRPPKVVELGSYHAMLGCVAAGMGAALMTESVLSLFPGKDQISAQRLEPPFDVIDVSLAWRRGAASPAVSALREILAA